MGRIAGLVFFPVVASVSLAAVLANPIEARAVDVVACGQVVSGGGPLTGDLDCTGFAGAAVVVEGGSFNLAGFTLTGGTAEGVHCTAACKVVSEPPGGTITGSGGAGVSGYDGLRNVAVAVSSVIVRGNNTVTFGAAVAGGAVTVSDSIIDANGAPGISSSDPVRVTVTGSEITNNAGHGVYGSSGSLEIEKRSVRVFDSTIADNAGDGILASWDTKITLVGSQIARNTGRGIQAQAALILCTGSAVVDNGDTGIESDRGGRYPNRVKARNCEASRNGGDGIHVDSVRGTGMVASENAETGLWAISTIVSDCTSVDNGHYGVLAPYRARLARCAVTGNGYAGFAGGADPVVVTDSEFSGNGHDSPACEPTGCADLSTSNAPRLGGSSSCERSHERGSGYPGYDWDVCSLD